jgi:hypothetical protein
MLAFGTSPSKRSTSSPFLRCACSRADDMNTRHVTGSHRDRAAAAGFGATRARVRCTYGRPYGFSLRQNT